MLDVKKLRQNFTEMKTKLQKRGDDLAGLERFQELDEARRSLIVNVEELKSRRNQVSEEVAQLKREKKGCRSLNSRNAPRVR